MPHPENQMDPESDGTDGLPLFESLAEALGAAAQGISVTQRSRGAGPGSRADACPRGYAPRGCALPRAGPAR